jgi:hypothetical protein
LSLLHQYMRRYSLACLATSLFLFWLGFTVPLHVLAQASPPQIELSVSQASPGATIEVSGGRFPEDALVKFVMQNSEKQISLGTVIADDHGEFSMTVSIPVDTQYGQYEFWAVDEKNQIAKDSLTIVPDPNGEEQVSQRSEEDPLLAPMPTLVPGAPTSALAGAPVPPKSPADSNYGSIALVGGLIGGVVLLFAIIAKRRS